MLITSLRPLSKLNLQRLGKWKAPICLSFSKFMISYLQQNQVRLKSTEFKYQFEDFQYPFGGPEEFLGKVSATRKIMTDEHKNCLMFMIYSEHLAQFLLPIVKQLINLKDGASEDFTEQILKIAHKGEEIRKRSEPSDDVPLVILVKFLQNYNWESIMENETILEQYRFHFKPAFDYHLKFFEYSYSTYVSHNEKNFTIDHEVIGRFWLHQDHLLKFLHHLSIMSRTAEVGTSPLPPSPCSTLPRPFPPTPLSKPVSTSEDESSGKSEDDATSENKNERGSIPKLASGKEESSKTSSINESSPKADKGKEDTPETFSEKGSTPKTASGDKETPNIINEKKSNTALQVTPSSEIAWGDPEKFNFTLEDPAVADYLRELTAISRHRHRVLTYLLETKIPKPPENKELLEGEGDIKPDDSTKLLPEAEVKSPKAGKEEETKKDNKPTET